MIKGTAINPARCLVSVAGLAGGSATRISWSTSWHLWPKLSMHLVDNMRIGSPDTDIRYIHA